MQSAIRDGLVVAVYDAFVAAYPAVPLVTDNAPFDWNNLPAEFVRYEIQFLGGSQIGMSRVPRSRLKGFIYVTAYAREGEGSSSSLGIVDWFSNVLKYQGVAGVQIQAPEPDGSGPAKGWYCEKIKFYFYSDPQ